MSEREPPEPAAPQEGADERDAIAALIKRSLGKAPGGESPPDVLRGVQRKIRRRSKGKFFADGWSTRESRVSYAVVALVMLVVMVVAYFGLAWITVR